MKKRLLALAVFGVFAFAFAVASGCGDSNKSDDPSRLPDRGVDASKPPGDTGTTAPPSCSGSTLKVSDTPACDTCAKDKCCTEVLACDNSSDCRALGDCLSKCADTDFTCILACQAAHDNGTAHMQDLGSCAQLKCKVECPDQTPDANLFDAF